MIHNATHSGLNVCKIGTDGWSLVRKVDGTTKIATTSMAIMSSQQTKNAVSENEECHQEQYGIATALCGNQFRIRHVIYKRVLELLPSTSGCTI